MRDLGLMIKDMAKDMNCTKTVMSIRECSKEEKQMELANIFGTKVERFMREGG